MYKSFFFSIIFILTFLSNSWSTDTFAKRTFQTYVNYSVEQTPFLDDDGNPIVEEQASPEEDEKEAPEASDEAAG